MYRHISGLCFLHKLWQRWNRFGKGCRKSHCNNCRKNHDHHCDPSGNTSYPGRSLNGFSPVKNTNSCKICVSGMCINDIIIFSFDPTSYSSVASIHYPDRIHSIYDLIFRRIQYMSTTVLNITKSCLSHSNIFYKILNTFQIQINQNHTNSLSGLIICN